MKEFPFWLVMVLSIGSYLYGILIGRIIEHDELKKKYKFICK